MGLGLRCHCRTGGGTICIRSSVSRCRISSTASASKSRWMSTGFSHPTSLSGAAAAARYGGLETASTVGPASFRSALRP
jgi:hypothetical protein